MARLLVRKFNTSASSSLTRVGFIGAGAANFGGGEGPWNHSKRLEYFGNTKEYGNIEIVAISDINKDHAQDILNKKKLSSNTAHLYENCQIFSDWRQMINSSELNLNTIIIGTPPATRGSNGINKDMELQCIQKGYDILVEKPLSNDKINDFLPYALKINDTQTTTKSVRYATRNPIISVGYMFRYHPGIQAINEILASNIHNNNILHLNMRYQTAYPFINKQFWWNQDLSGGPIVEQATHFVDIARYLTGECVLNTLKTNVIFYNENGLQLQMIDQKDVNLNIIPKDKINQIISCIQWKTDRGSIVSLSHGIHLHHKRYESYLDVWTDGLSMNLINPYDDQSKLRVRQSLSRTEDDNIDIKCDEYTLEFDVNNVLHDPYHQEMKCFLMSIQNENNNTNFLIQSDYNDAAYTYCLTRDIQNDIMSQYQYMEKK